eukprot:GHRR01007956.1.p1 GENE.GHRR01007956.1~~GHRR01007956.1.p1  ORF type:complete len:287 (+),score=125.47 GHRR01007956.1:347-1207(+)
MGRKAHPLAARIKKMMQTDDDVGKISQATPIMIARAMELFLQRLCSNAADIAASRKAKTLTTSHLKAYVSSDELMDFLKDTVASAPDLPPEGAEEAPKPKRQRTSESKRQPRASIDNNRSSEDGAAVPAAAAAPPKDGATAQKLKQEPKQEDSGSPSAVAAQAKQRGGLSGLGGHPFLGGRKFDKPGTSKLAPKKGNTRKSNEHGSQKVKQEQQHKDGQVAAADDAAAADDDNGPFGAQQQKQEAAAAVGDTAAAALPVLPGMLSIQALASYSNRPQDDFDDDYDS